MLKIAICDDEKKYIDDIEMILNKYGMTASMEMNIETYTDGYEVVKRVNDDVKYNIIFLDIEMNNINGIELAEKIRDKDMHVPIVYVTSHQDYWKQAYKVHAFQFVVKPITEDEIFSVIDDLMSIYESDNENKVILKCEEETIYAKQSDILYFYIEKKKTVHTKICDKKYIVKENLRDIYEKLNKEDFYPSHKSCLVNFNHIKKLENGYDIIMEDGEFMPLAQNKKADFMDKLTDHYIRTVNGRR